MDCMPVNNPKVAFGSTSAHVVRCVARKLGAVQASSSGPRTPRRRRLRNYANYQRTNTLTLCVTKSYPPYRQTLIHAIISVCFTFILPSGIDNTAKSKCCCSIWQREWPGTKSISVIAKVAWYKINFIGSQLSRKESELIRIPGLVPLIFVGFC